MTINEHLVNSYHSSNSTQDPIYIAFFVWFTPYLFNHLVKLI